jgi:ABC-type multidrug transport system ATPase subunit
LPGISSFPERPAVRLPTKRRRRHLPLPPKFKTPNGLSKTQTPINILFLRPHHFFLSPPLSTHMLPSNRQNRSHSDDVELLIMPQTKGLSSDGDHPHVDVEKQYQSPASTSFHGHVNSLAWTDLTVTVKDRNTGHQRDILYRISGIARPGEMIALMGPSGSGKTTLLNTLAQRQKQGVAGKVLINGSEAPINTHRALSSFVEQEDTLIGSLTVEETLRFAARLALPSTVTKTEARQRVSSLIDSFGLTKQKNTLIGTPIQKGISGGQKRRVSVATQLVTGPKILYLDEPTSGLDSTASYEVMSFIRNIARETGVSIDISDSTSPSLH